MMKTRARFEILPLFGSALAGWCAMILPFAVWMLVIPHGPGFAPEVGPHGTFIFFGAGMTAVYCVNFAVATVVHFVRQIKRLNAAKTGLAWGAGFVLSIPVWLLVCGTKDIVAESVGGSPFAFLSGFAAGYCLSRFKKQRAEDDLSREIRG